MALAKRTDGWYLHGERLVSGDVIDHYYDVPMASDRIVTGAPPSKESIVITAEMLAEEDFGSLYDLRDAELRRKYNNRLTLQPRKPANR